MPFDDAIWPPVAIPAESRHDAATCCGERQEPDVGEGWRWLDKECLRPGDMVLIHPSSGDPHRECYFMEIDKELFGSLSGPPGNFRRRVTPNAQPIEITPAVISAICRRNERDALLKRIEKLKAEHHEQQEKILQACLENERLRSEVERLRLEPSVQEEIVAWSVDLHDAREEIKKLQSEVKRLRLLIHPDSPRSETASSGENQ